LAGKHKACRVKGRIIIIIIIIIHQSRLLSAFHVYVFMVTAIVYIHP